MQSTDIITYGVNYDYYVYERFVGSLNKTGFTGKIHIIIRDKDVSHIHKLQQFYSNVIYFIDNATKLHIHINNHRFFVINNYINANLITSEYVFFCDMRDVLFQLNIQSYKIDTNVDLYGFLEGIKIHQDKQCNSKWIKELETIMDIPIYDKISNNHVICCGTTLAKTNIFKIYVSTMCDILTKFNITTNLDQGIHNYIIYLNVLKNVNVHLLTNEDNLVNTVGCDLKLLNNHNFIINKSEQISYVVHQYDRFIEDFKQKISENLGYNFILH